MLGLVSQECAYGLRGYAQANGTIISKTKSGLERVCTTYIYTQSIVYIELGH